MLAIGSTLAQLSPLRPIDWEDSWSETLLTEDPYILDLVIVRIQQITLEKWSGIVCHLFGQQ